MDDRGARVARAIRAFVESPVTNLVKGMILLLIGLSEASRTVMDDLARKQLRIGHGLIIIGLFGILGALPPFIGGVRSSSLYLDRRANRSKAASDLGGDPGRDEGRDS